VTGEADIVGRAVAAVRGGDVDVLREVLAEQPGLAASQLGGDVAGRTLLHVLTDWPGHRPNATETVAVLVEAGADVDAPFVGPHAETPLHWAASSDDVDAIDALLDASAQVDARGGSVGVGSGTPLFDATVFGQWAASRRLSDWDGLTPLDAAVRAAGEGIAGADEVVAWLRGQGARSAAAAKN
jgi:hypothetical protein